MEAIKEKLIEWARKYNTPSFIYSDPIQFPRKYIHSKKDAEVSGLLTALISFGNRKQIIKKAQELDDMFKGNPYKWIMEDGFCLDISYQSNHCFYRTISDRKMYDYCIRIKNIIIQYESIEKYVRRWSNTEYEWIGWRMLSAAFGYALNSSAKRIAMFMRWMVRDDGIVDLGIWKSISKKDLIIPLDTHVHKMALELGITNRKTTDLKTAMEITEYMKTVFPDDPLLGDFALFGYGVNRGKEDGNAL